MTHAHSVGFLWTSDQSDTKPVPYNPQHSHKTDNHTPGGVRTRNPSNERPQTDTLDRVATEIGDFVFHVH